jgi:hypothetical protein
VSGWHLNFQIHLTRYLDADLKVIVLEMSAIDRKLGLSGSSRELKTGMHGANRIIGLA